MSDQPVVGRITFGRTMTVSNTAPPNFTADARDAARYRWLREQIKDDAARVKAQALLWNFNSREQFDEAVDAAMRGE